MVRMRRRARRKEEEESTTMSRPLVAAVSCICICVATSVACIGIVRRSGETTAVVLTPEGWPRDLPGAEGGGTSWVGVVLLLLILAATVSAACVQNFRQLTCNTGCALAGAVADSGHAPGAVLDASTNRGLR